MSVSETPAGILTFLIADVRGYTAFTQANGDEAAARLADKFAEIVREGVAAHGGDVTELRGDEALAVFSSPRAAVRAAVDLQAVLADETTLDPSLPLRVGIGIDAGEAVPVQGGYRGGALNLAARLCSKATAGEVLVSQGIAHLTRAVDGIELVGAGEAEVKGLSAPVPVFRAQGNLPPVSLRAEASGELPSALDAVTPIVGREAEARQLRWLWRIARRGSPQTGVVIGPPGIGKTRLVAELAATAAAGGGDCRYVTFATGASDGIGLPSPPGERAELLVLDDVEMASEEQLRAVASAVAQLAGPRMVVLVVEDQSATTEVLATARRLAGDDRHVVRPRPLSLEEMLKVAGFYLGSAADAVPTELLNETGGVPRLVHETISDWAQAYAARRLGDLAAAAATRRTGLRDIESDLAGTVVDLQQVREQATLFGLGPGRRAPEPTESPYRGLASFETADAELYFGRERLVAELISRLAGTNILGVVGASGSGKSSAVRAGLIPALASGVLPGSEAWTVALLRPGEHPLRSLDRALWAVLPPTVTATMADSALDLDNVRTALNPDERLVVVIDQFEEAFTLCHDEHERAELLATIARTAADADPRIAFVLTVRADYYGRVAGDAQLAVLLAANHVLVGAMNAEEYRRAIVQPALRVGAVIEPDLADELVSEVLGEPGALPLLSTTLLELWNDRDGRTLRLSAYRESGGLHGAVARLADDVYDSFDSDSQTVARALFLRLAGPGLGDTAVRRRVPLSEFDVERDETVREVLDVLAARRLVTISDGTAEVAHEALLREWPRLQAWLEEDREGRRLRAHLTVAAQEWVSSGRDASELYRGARLSAALDWTTSHALELNEVEREFVTESREVSQAELNRQRAQNRRLRGLLVGVVGLLVVALIAGGIALAQRRSAQRSALTANSQKVAALSLTAPDLRTSLLLAVASYRLQNSVDSRSAMLSALQRNDAALWRIQAPARILFIAASADGRDVWVMTNERQIYRYDTRTRRLLSSFPARADQTTALSPDGRQLIVAGASGFFDPDTARVSVLDATNGSVEAVLPTPGWSPVFTGDGRTLALVAQSHSQGGSAPSSYMPTSRVELYDTSNYARPGRTVQLSSPVVSLVAARNELVALTLDGHIDIIRARDGAVVASARRPELAQPSLANFQQPALALSPDGSALAYSAFSTPDLVDVLPTRNLAGTPRAFATLDGAALSIVYSPTGRLLAASSDQGEIDVLHASDGSAAVRTNSQQASQNESLAWSGSAAADTGLYAGGLDSQILSLDLSAGPRLVHVQGPSMPADGQTWKVGDHIVTASATPSPQGEHDQFLVTDPATGRTRTIAYRLPRGQSSINVTVDAAVNRAMLDYSLDSEPPYAGGAIKMHHELIALPSGRILKQLNVTPTPSAHQNLSSLIAPDGNTAVIATGDHQMSLYQLPSGRLLKSFPVDFHGPQGNRPVVTPLAWSPNGKQVLIDRFDHLTKVGPPPPAPVPTETGPPVDQGIAIVDPFHGKLLGEAGGFGLSGTPDTAAWSPDGKWVAVGTVQGAVQVFDAASLHPVSDRIDAAAGFVQSVDFSPDGQTVVVGGTDGEIGLYDASTLRPIGPRIRGDIAASWWPFFRSDGSVVGYSPDSSGGQRWFTMAAQPSQWANDACSLAGDSLSRAEWDRYVGSSRAYRQVCPSVG